MSSKLRSFVLYGADNKVVPMSLLRLKKPPQTSVSWVEISSDICCTDAEAVRQGSKFKAFVGIDSRGNTLSGPIIRYSQPKNGKWLQIKYDLCCDTTITVPEITTPPADDTVNEGETASFSVVATGGELTYQWYKDGALISGATGSSYTTPVTTAADDGAEFTVTVTNELGSVTSDPAILTVNTP